MTNAPSSAAKKPRESQAERREKAETAILQAAVEIIAEQGLEAFTLAEAGARAGYSRALPGHYFGSKEGAIAAVCNDLVMRYRRRAQRATDATGRDVPLGLANLLDRIAFYFDDANGEPSVPRVFHAILGAAPNDPILAQAIMQITAEARASFAANIAAGIQAGDISSHLDPETDAIWILGALRGVIAQWIVDPDRTDMAQLRDTFLERVKTILSPPQTDGS